MPTYLLSDFLCAIVPGHGRRCFEQSNARSLALRNTSGHPAETIASSATNRLLEITIGRMMRWPVRLRRENAWRIGQDTTAAFVRAILFGVGAAVLGLILYAAFAVITGIFIGYASLGGRMDSGQGHGQGIGRDYRQTLSSCAPSCSRTAACLGQNPRLDSLRIPTLQSIVTAVVRWYPRALVSSVYSLRRQSIWRTDRPGDPVRRAQYRW